MAARGRVVAAHDDLSLTALHTATTSLGSLVLGLALVARRIDAEEAFAASVLDEDFQIERWGEDAEAARRRAAIRAALDAVADFVDRLAGEPVPGAQRTAQRRVGKDGERTCR